MRLPFCTLIFLLAACGQSGDLYRPDAVPAPKPASVPVVVQPPGAPESEEEDEAPAVPVQPASPQP